MVRQELVAETFAHRKDGEYEFGSGYLIAPGLVLTAAHAVVIDGLPASGVEVRFPGSRLTVTGQVAWWRSDETADMAVVVVAGAKGCVPAAAPVRWGRLTGQRAGVRCEAIGYPEAQRDSRGVRDTEHLSGTINPGTRAKARRHDVLVDNWPEPGDELSAWAGLSGAAVFCGDLLTAVIVADPLEFASRRLTAVPVAEFLRDPGFVALAGEHTAESVELSQLFEPETAQGGARSPAYLLRADAEVVPFHGRTELMADLSAWCESADAISAWLVTGPGGQGKTRLARELAALRRAAGWAVGWLRPDDGDLPDFDRLAESAVPVLAVIDYVETRADQVKRLLTLLSSAESSGPRVRLLLLARRAGEWWRQLVASSATIERALASRVTELPPLEATADGRAAMFTTAAEHFAEALHRDQLTLPLPEPPSDLADERYGPVLTIHMTALVALLQSGTDPVPEERGDSVEDVLLRHEERYWDKTAHARGLRFAYAKALPRAVSVATLFTASTEAEAAGLLGLMPGLRDQPEEPRLALAEWLHDLYPSTDGRYWGRLQPDRLGERLVARVTADNAGLFDDLFAQVPANGTLYAFGMLSKAAAVQPAMADAIERLVSARPELAPIAAAAATRSDHPDPLVKAIESVTDQLTNEPGWLDKLIAVTWAAPSLFGEWSVRAAQKLLDRYRDLARAEPATYQPKLARQLYRTAEQLNTIGQAAESLAPAEEAEALWRTLPDDGNNGLAPTLSLLAGIYSARGQPAKAVSMLTESVALFERQDPPDPYGTVMALCNLSACLKDTGDLRGSLHAAGRALDSYDQVPVHDRDAWLTITVTKAATNKANRLTDLGYHAAGLVILREVVDTRRRMVQDLPGLFDGDLASGLHNLAVMFARAGDLRQALENIDQCVSIYRQLTSRLPAVYLSKLAETLGLQGILLNQAGKPLTAVESLAEAERIAIEIGNTAVLLSARTALELTRSRFPRVKQHMSQMRRPGPPGAPPNQDGAPQTEEKSPANVIRKQPKRQSRQDRKKK